ncbi:MAG: M28 family metallopeptidase, partial [Armatimonadota bacterium]
LTCHHDSVSLGEGAEDNGTGMAVLLALAEALGRGTPPRPIKLISCGWEENLSEGSRQYVAADPERAEKAALVINIDSVGAWMGKDWVNVVGNDSLVQWAENRLSEVPYSAEVIRKVSPYSDMFPFNLVGVPSLWFYRSNCGDTRFYHHSAQDTLDKISFDELAKTAEAVGNCVWHIGGEKELPFERGIPDEQVDEIEGYRDRLLNSICDWKTQGLMKPDTES